MNGLLRCSRYAFGPNRLHYCGPDQNQEILAYIDSNTEDPGLARLLRGFQTLYPYLKVIAEANEIADPFDARIVEAYWIGNSLLDRVSKRALYNHLIEDKGLKKRIGAKLFNEVDSSIDAHALPHHSFHVFDVWRRTGNLDDLDMIEKLDSCRISSGVVENSSGPFVTIKTRPLRYFNGKLTLGDSISKKITRSFEADIDIEEIKKGDLVSIHWDVICEKITQDQADMLERYTLHHLNLANKTI
ncbi:MAG: hypothetical protein KKF44_02330 [Nanoarchaeota archaeon]|nr:hypothetical protein [Nanoarchaeota archaeon]